MSLSPYVLSNDAAQDVTAMYVYSLQQWGESQAEAYIDGLYEQFETLQSHPHAGRDVSLIRANTRRLLYQRHAIYYHVSAKEIRILRILHQRMDPARHFLRP